MPKERRSFFERLTGSMNVESNSEAGGETAQLRPNARTAKEANEKNNDWAEEEEGQLTIDVFQTPDEIVIQGFVAGVRLDDLDVSITQDMLTIRGRRQRLNETTDEDYYYQELYWGSFARSILLPQEVDADDAQATLKNGMLTIRLKKRDKKRIQKLRVKHE
ncbi:MAG: hypothetical protein A3C80_04270 [Candidatus Ryanbacteria bacterium RIFCSPHIGHO2_02_FULL_45_43]|uniref:Uncharacterized protein n=1 Tax=Candidatus Ryanbacteria bacterium RIFCSPHIGHO2_01_45_13 TaxID=1802112 RepID=A0A1G2FYW8_9BACT|nr:MAG: hypothetical protein A2718_00295 [Candidatus Ryanbacteria bacterium RIFCSPHIGHO2_01_FULL_44_130]OGZ42808.1 MAG: hypothetical protein A2W41_00615 [Candidatus Ryanbacteria bacterium RIFCSPHIGHO2_01_45_13]OGZ48247.1 MAG: hypothetical protein A3C80_04270 [Candidatus Ryanbacteria bacterium RIFCSPHIGHO2_02_FULL_45_43]OGZ50023.1 MAG: hypothetical protein A3E55_01930 [Candidatus Ryanbacteria bacterium RIFCSPHIGHO2_12_FULL_44_20]OGZ51481.1 MAG: hypothetical protein A3A17_01875 [Candidatus Ryanba